MILSPQHLNRLRLVLAKHPQVRRAIYVEDAARPVIAFEYDERPPSVEEAQRRVCRLVEAVAPALGRARFEVGLSAGGPEEIAPTAERGEVIYERGAVS